MTQTQQAEALAVRSNGSQLRTVEDNSEFSNLLDSSRFGHLQRVATLFSESQLVPAHYQGNVANCFIGLQMAIRMGVDPFMFFQNTYIVYGRPGMEAKLAIALINSSGLFKDSLDYEIVGENPAAQDYKARAFAVRKTTGKAVYGPWVDWKLVKAEEWHSKKGSKWMTMPALMFLYRAATFFGRLHCPERLMGMQTVDELRDTGDLPADRNVVSAANQPSRAALLEDRLTGRPAESQTIEPNPDGASNNNIATHEPHELTVDVPQDAKPTTTEPKVFSALNEAALDLGFPPSYPGTFWADYRLRRGFKGKEFTLNDAQIATACVDFAEWAKPLAKSNFADNSGSA